MSQFNGYKRNVMWAAGTLTCLVILVTVPSCRFFGLEDEVVNDCTTVADCNDGDPCTTDKCNIFSAEPNASGTCQHIPDCKSEADCDDGDPCTTDLCFFNCCTFEPIMCEDDQVCQDGVCGKPCTSDSDCDDMDLCTQDTCPDGVCQNTLTVECDDNDLCTTDSCNSSTGECDFLTKTCPTPEICDPATGDCVPKRCVDDGECDDGVFCNGKETCDALPGLEGDCQKGTNPCPDSDCIEASMSCGEVSSLLDARGNYAGTTVCGDDDDQVSFDDDAGTFFGLGFNAENRTFFLDEPIGLTSTATDQDVFGTSGNDVTITAIDSSTIHLAIVGPSACSVDLSKLPG